MKYIIFAKTIYTYTKNSFISIFSFFLIKVIPKRNISEVINTFKNKKVLVLGTGPSLNNLNQNLIDKYDIVFFLNGAISVSKIFNFEKKKKIFFNSDLFRFITLKKNIYDLDKKWTHIFIPTNIQLFFSFIFFYFRKNVFLIIPEYRIGSPFEKNVTKSIITYNLAKNQDTKNLFNILNFRPFPYTVALNAFYFLISCNVKQIHYLGCDFSSGKSEFTNYKGTSDFSDKKIYLWINKLKKLSKNYSIDFEDLR